MGVKRIIKCDDIKIIDVPQFEGLSIREIFAFAANSVLVQNVLPPSKEIPKLSRGNNIIAMDPQIAQIFNQSTSISGKSSSDVFDALFFNLDSQYLYLFHFM
jgi:hypothetical protein